MREIMDRLYACLTELDNTIRRQRHALATIDALDNMKRLETARKHIRDAQIVLAYLEGDALPALASPLATQTPSGQPGK